MIRQGNLFEAIPATLPEELVERLAEGAGNLVIERIVSRGHVSPAGFWYEQESTEWVVLLNGAAVLSFEGRDEPVVLGPGDWVEIPARCRHRVEETSSRKDTVWLAVHWK